MKSRRVPDAELPIAVVGAAPGKKRRTGVEEGSANPSVSHMLSARALSQRAVTCVATVWVASKVTPHRRRCVWPWPPLLQG